MQARGAVAVLRKYLVLLVSVILLPLLWMRMLKVADRHKGDDPRARTKVLAAIAVGLVLAGGGAVLVLKMHDSAIDGFYDSAEERLRIRTGESAYQDRVEAIRQADNQIPIVLGNLPAAEAAVQENRTRAGDAFASDPDYIKANATLAGLRQTLAGAYAAKEKAYNEINGTIDEGAVGLRDNHLLYERIQPLAADRDDEAVIQATQDYVAARPGNQVHKVDPQSVTNVYILKDRMVDEMNTMLVWFVWPSLAGLLLAPLAFAMGSILKASFRESDTVGFKPYPGTAAGFVLLLGAFGAPSIPFAAWVFTDVEARSEEGQIAL